MTSFFEMVKNFAKETKEFIKQGAPSVTEAQYKERLDECDSCPHLIRKEMRCGLCGCMVEHKAKWQTSNCPDKRWTKIVVGEDGKKLNLKDGRKDNTTKAVDGVQPPNQKS